MNLSTSSPGNVQKKKTFEVARLNFPISTFQLVWFVSSPSPEYSVPKVNWNVPQEARLVEIDR